MPLTTSHSFIYLLNQLENDLHRAASLCREIKRLRDVGPVHTQLDALERELADGPDFILSERRKLVDLEWDDADVDGGDELFRANLATYARQVKEINERLDTIAHPPRQTHRRHHSQNSFFYSRPYHREQVPHFHELRQKWEETRDGISQTFSEYRYQLAKEIEAKKRKKKDDKEKAKKRREEEKEAEERDKLRRRIEEKEKEDLARLREMEQENTRLKQLQRAQTTKLKHVEDVAEKRDEIVEALLKKTVEKDQVQDLERLANAMGNIRQAVSPRRSHDIIPIRSHSPEWYGRRAESARPISYPPYNNHDYGHPMFPDPRYRRHSRRSSYSPRPHAAPPREVVINNLIEGVGRGQEGDVEDINIGGDHVFVSGAGRRDVRYTAPLPPRRQHVYHPVRYFALPPRLSDRPWVYPISRKARDTDWEYAEYPGSRRHSRLEPVVDSRGRRGLFLAEENIARGV